MKLFSHSLNPRWPRWNPSRALCWKVRVSVSVRGKLHMYSPLPLLRTHSPSCHHIQASSHFPLTLWSPREGEGGFPVDSKGRHTQKIKDITHHPATEHEIKQLHKCIQAGSFFFTHFAVFVCWQEMRTSEQMDCLYNWTSCSHHETLAAQTTAQTHALTVVVILYHIEKWFLPEESVVSFSEDTQPRHPALFYSPSVSIY